MSGPTIPSLSSIVDQVPATQADPASSSPVVQTARPDLQSIIDSALPVGLGQNAPTAKIGEPAYVDSHQHGQVSSAVLRDLLVKRGLEVPEELDTDDLIAEALVNEFNTAATAFETPDYKAYLSWKDQQAVAEKAKLAQPVAPEKPAGPQSQELLNAIRQGIVSYDGIQKKWAASHPQFDSYAEAMNNQDQKANQAKISLASDPEAFVSQKIKEAISEMKPASETSELKELLQQIRQERAESAEQSKITLWENANLTKLYVPVTGEMTPYGKAYQEIESEIEKVNPRLGLLERHNQVLRQLAIVEKYLPAARQATSQPAAVAPKQSFLDAASRRNGTNRLSEYQGAALNSVAPQIPRGKSGFPSLAGIIEQSNSLTGN
jgi:hypothetical protein